MEYTHKNYKIYKGGEIVISEHHDMHLVNSNPFIRECFQRVGCFTFCEKLQKGHMEVSKEFALNFDGFKTKVGSL